MTYATGYVKGCEKMNSQETENKKTEEIEAPKAVKYQCLHTEEARECTCIRSKGLVLKK